MKTNFLLLLTLAVLSACPAAGPGAGAPASGTPEAGFAAGGSSNNISAGPNTGSSDTAPDVAMAVGDKPNPGGVVAPSPDWEEPTQYNLVGTANPICRQETSFHAETTFILYWLKGRVFEIKESSGEGAWQPPLQPLESCAGRIIREIKGDSLSNLSALACKDFPLNENCEFEGAVLLRKIARQEEEPVLEFPRFFLSREAIDPNVAPCEKVVQGSAFLPAAGVISFSEAPRNGLPACRK